MSKTKNRLKVQSGTEAWAKKSNPEFMRLFNNQTVRQGVNIMHELQKVNPPDPTAKCRFCKEGGHLRMTSKHDESQFFWLCQWHPQKSGIVQLIDIPGSGIIRRR